MQEDPLATIPLFASLQPRHRAELAARLQRRSVAAQQTIFWIGDAGDEFFVVRAGEVVLTMPDDGGKESVLALLQPGAFFGELSLMDGGPRTATARAQSDAELLALSRTHFLEFVARHPDASIHIIGVLAQRQRETLQKLRGIRNANEVELSRSTTWMKIADFIASTTASKGFVITHLAFVGGWIGLNLALRGRAFDPFPFLLLGMIASLEAIFLSIFVLISQNRQTEKDRIQADLDYQVNVKSHLEVMSLHQKLDALSRKLDPPDPPHRPPAARGPLEAMKPEDGDLLDEPIARN
jgi:uncharacterized membrane protein